jgi:predicted amidophosphoribosyltransferase
MKQTTRTRGLNLTLNGEDIKLGRYEDIAHNQNTDNNIIYRFNFNYESKLTNEDRPLECPICGKNYKESGWYERHIRESHKHFWEHSSGEIQKYENYPPEKPHIELNYRYNENIDANELNRLKIGYPVPVGSLFLSEIKINFTTSRVNLLAKDLNNNTVIDVPMSSDEFNSREFQRIGEISRLAEHVLNGFTTTDTSRRVLRYTENQPYISDQYMPSAYKFRDEIEDIIHHMGSNDAKNEDIGDYDDLAKNVLNGILRRLASSINQSMIMVGSISDLGTNTTHVGPLRRSPQRIYSASGADSDEQYFRGVNIEDRLLGSPDHEESPILEKTNKWLDKTGFNCKLKIDQVGVGDIFQLNVVEDGMSVNVADSGFGLSQSIPILIECINMSLEKSTPRQQRPNTIFQPAIDHHITIVEEPEIHLNPKIESRIADFFIDIYEDGTGILIETHSEHIVNRMQRRIAEGSMDEDDITIYFIEKNKKVTNIREIEINENGAFEEWPEGFFQENFDDAIEMLKNNINK